MKDGKPHFELTPAPPKGKRKKAAPKKKPADSEGAGEEKSSDT